VLDVLSKFPAARWAISSFNWDTLYRLRELAPGAELWPLADHCDASVLEIGAALGSPVLALAAESFTSANAREIQEAGFNVMVWTVNDIGEARRLRDLDAWAICTDDPSLIATALGQQSRNV
jgi:glycerophosphoryl diester phosphodiesterase